MANVTYSVVARACEMLMIWKVFWKSVVLPCVLSCTEVMVWRKAQRDKLQRIENNVWRKVMGAPGYAPVVTLQGEVGCSSVKSRDMKGKLTFARYMTDSESGIMRKLWQRMRRAEGGGYSWGLRGKQILECFGEDIRGVGRYGGKSYKRES